MAFISNLGSTAALPFSPSIDRYMQVAHPAVADVLLLQWMPEGGDGYTPAQLTGQLVPKGRGQSGSILVLTGQSQKLEWRDLSFVATASQVQLLEQLALAQSAVSPLTLVDNMLLGYSVKSVVLVLPDKYKSLYAGTTQFLIQFSFLQV